MGNMKWNWVSSPLVLKLPKGLLNVIGNVRRCNADQSIGASWLLHGVSCCLLARISVWFAWKPILRHTNTTQILSRFENELFVNSASHKVYIFVFFDVASPVFAELVLGRYILKCEHLCLFCCFGSITYVGGARTWHILKKFLRKRF